MLVEQVLIASHESELNLEGSTIQTRIVLFQPAIEMYLLSSRLVIRHVSHNFLKLLRELYEFILLLCYAFSVISMRCHLSILSTFSLFIEVSLHLISHGEASLVGFGRNVWWDVNEKENQKNPVGVTSYQFRSVNGILMISIDILIRSYLTSYLLNPSQFLFRAH